jgi:hypothetical protein
MLNLTKYSLLMLDKTETHPIILKQALAPHTALVVNHKHAFHLKTRAFYYPQYAIFPNLSITRRYP